MWQILLETHVDTICTFVSGSKGSIPRISYPKAIDIWMSVCMFFVFGTLIEYAFVNALSRKQQRRTSSLGNRDTELGNEEVRPYLQIMT